MKSSAVAWISPSPPVTYGRSDSRLTLSGRAANTLPVNVVTRLPVISPSELEFSKKPGTIAKSASTPKKPSLSPANDPPSVSAFPAPSSKIRNVVSGANEPPMNGVSSQSADASEGEAATTSAANTASPTLRTDGALMAKVLDLLGSQPKPIAELLSPFRKYHSTGEVNFHVEDKAGAMEALAAAFKDGKQDRLDGITVEFDDWWFNVRPSNTEPLLRLNIEAATTEMLEEKRKAIVEVLQKSGAKAE